MNLPVLCQTSEADEKLGLSRRLNLHDVQLPDPLKMDVLNDFKHSPPVGLFDIFNHLIYHSSEYDKQGLQHINRTKATAYFRMDTLNHCCPYTGKMLEFMCMLQLLYIPSMTC